MDGKDWTHLKIRPETKDRLIAMRDRIALAAELGLADAWWKGETLTLDDVLRKLIDREDRKRVRSKASKARRKRDDDNPVWDNVYALA